MNDLEPESIFISALNKSNLEAFKEKTYDEVRKIHVKRFRYSHFLYDTYEDESVK